MESGNVEIAALIPSLKDHQQRNHGRAARQKEKGESEANQRSSCLKYRQELGCGWSAADKN
jgi:hypothetical protein